MKVGKYVVSPKAIAAIIATVGGWALAHQAGIQSCAAGLGLSPTTQQIIGWVLGGAGVLAASQTDALVKKGSV